MNLELLEGRIFGARYYTVRPIFDAHPETWFRNEWDEIEQWCQETFGPTPDDSIWTPAQRWYVNNSKFWFRNEADRTVFVLKWG